ncbi:RNA methyltransferase [Cytophagales bacterium WSM2-2]|nr:RNA methyltransferase [Cytophagales bacterium WSM2-2]
MAYNEKLADRIREQLLGTRGVIEKKMFGGVAFMWKDKMFCGVMKEDMMVRVLEENYDDLVERPHARPMDFMKTRTMRGLLYVSLDGLKTETQLATWIAIGKEYVEKTPPKKKPAKKKTKSK